MPQPLPWPRKSHFFSCFVSLLLFLSRRSSAPAGTVEEVERRAILMERVLLTKVTVTVTLKLPMTLEKALVTVNTMVRVIENALRFVIAPPSRSGREKGKGVVTKKVKVTMTVTLAVIQLETIMKESTSCVAHVIASCQHARHGSSHLCGLSHPLFLHLLNCHCHCQDLNTAAQIARSGILLCYFEYCAA